MTYINIDVDLDDIISGLSSRELQRLADDLYDDGYYQTKLERKLDEDDSSHISINEQFFRKDIFKIRKNYLSLTQSELEILSEIAKRF